MASSTFDLECCACARHHIVTSHERYGIIVFQLVRVCRTTRLLRGSGLSVVIRGASSSITQ